HGLDARPFEDLDLVALFELHDRLLPARPAAAREPAALRLGLHLEDVHALHLDAEELLDRLADLRLVSVLVHPERVLAVGDERVALLRHDRSEEDLVRMQAHSARPSPAPAPAGQSPAPPAPDAARRRMLRARRASVPVRTVHAPRARLLCERRP